MIFTEGQEYQGGLQKPYFQQVFDIQTVIASMQISTTLDYY